MNRITTTIFAAILCCASSIWGQTAYKPTIMVVPARTWLASHNLENRADGYSRAIADSDMAGAITTMSDIMAENGYPLVSLEQTLSDLDTESAIDMVATSKDLTAIAEDDYDRLIRTAKADILVNLDISSRPYGPRRLVEFRVESVDAASGKTIHGDVGSSSASNAPSSVLLKEAVNAFIENFCAKIDRHFAAMEESGREISVIFKIADDAPLNFESEVTVDGERGELADYIDYWLGENTVGGNYSPNGKSRVRLAFNQVRIPLFSKSAKGGFGSKKGRVRPMDAESFIRAISTPLSGMGLSVSTKPIGIGKVFVVLGGA